METDPMQLSTTEIFPQNKNSAEIFTHEENMLNASEGLRADIEVMHEGAQTLIEEATANPLDVAAHEQGTALGLTSEEISSIIASDGNAEKDVALRDRAQALYGDFRGRLTKAAQIGVTAFAIGSSTPVLAEEVPLEPEITLQMAHVLEVQTHKSVIGRLRNSMTSATEFLGISVRNDGEELYAPTAFAKGTGAEASIDGGSIVEAMKSGTAEIEMVHTHPINADTKNMGGLDEDDEHLLDQGGIPNVTVPPSSRDLSSLLEVGADKYPAAQFSGKVITPSGDWEYGIRDSGAPYVAGMRKAKSEIGEMFRSLKFTDAEEAYAKKLENDTHSFGTLLQKLTHSDDPIARSIMEKLDFIRSGQSEITSKHTNPEDVEKMKNFDNFNEAWLRPGTPKGDAEIARREQIASELGFRMKFTPNPIVPKGENLDEGVTLQVTESIDPARLDALGSRYPYIDKEGNELVQTHIGEEIDTKE